MVRREHGVAARAEGRSRRYTVVRGFRHHASVGVSGY